MRYLALALVMIASSVQADDSVFTIKNRDLPVANASKATMGQQRTTGIPAFDAKNPAELNAAIKNPPKPTVPVTNTPQPNTGICTVDQEDYRCSTLSTFYADGRVIVRSVQKINPGIYRVGRFHTSTGMPAVQVTPIPNLSSHYIPFRVPTGHFYTIFVAAPDAVVRRTPNAINVPVGALLQLTEVAGINADDGSANTCSTQPAPTLPCKPSSTGH